MSLFERFMKKTVTRTELQDRLALFSTQEGIQNNVELIAPIVKQMAQTGAGTDECLRQGCLPMPVHFYSPVPDIEDLKRRDVFRRISPLSGVDFRPEQQIKLLTELGTSYGNECDWPATAIDDRYQFFTENGTFCFGCAAALHTIIRKFKPARIIEIGSGNSSLAISRALKANKQDKPDVNIEYTVIDPYPRDIISDGLPGLSTLIKTRIEDADLSVFEQLSENDILFVDSGHVVRTGSDVNLIILDILPVLAPGVIIHFHDVHMPYEYDEVYFTNPGFRMFWTESYLLQAFLAFNNEFETMLALSYLMTDKKDEFRKAFRRYNPDVHKAISGSYWIRRILPDTN